MMLTQMDEEASTASEILRAKLHDRRRTKIANALFPAKAA
jgi:hypothetical protein